MYRLCIQKDFKARHFLIGGDWGDENQLHEHHYKVELRLKGAQLDRHQYLVAMVELENALKDAIAFYENKVLNELKGFEEKNPSLELFCKNFSDLLAARLPSAGLDEITLRLWENESAWVFQSRFC